MYKWCLLFHRQLLLNRFLIESEAYSYRIMIFNLSSIFQVIFLFFFPLKDLSSFPSKNLSTYIFTDLFCWLPQKKTAVLWVVAFPNIYRISESIFLTEQLSFLLHVLSFLCFDRQRKMQAHLKNYSCVYVCAATEGLNDAYMHTR